MVHHSKKYDHLFDNIIPNSIDGIRIFTSKDEYKIKQYYNKITKTENKIWSRLFKKLTPLLDQYATREYLIGLKLLPINESCIPHFKTISSIIEMSTEWTLLPVAGFLDEELFFEINTKRQFPVTDIIRKSPRFEGKYAGIKIKNDIGYTPEPDVFHDLQGHVPFLTDKNYANFLWEIGQLGYQIIKDERGFGDDLVYHNLKRLQNFAWWTYEYGLMKKNESTNHLRKTSNDIRYEIYGAGIISSFDEVSNVIECAKNLSRRSKFKTFNIEEVAMTCFDYSNIQDRYYVIESMDELYESFYKNKELFFFEG